MSRPKVKHLDLDMAELEAILERTRSGPLSEEEHDRLKAVVTTLARLTQELEKKRTSITRLRNLLFGPRTEKTDEVLKQNGQKEDGSSAAGSSGKDKKKKPKGHGRNGADAYKGAKKVEVPHGSLKSGDPCPETDCTGKVYKLQDPGLIVRIKGLPPLGATVSFRQSCVAADPPARAVRLSGQEDLSGTWPGRVGDAWGGLTSKS